MNLYDATEEAYKNGYEKGKQDAMKWISVKERLPGVLEDCLVAVKMKYDWKEEYTYVVDFGYYAGKAGYIDEFYTQDDLDEGQQYIHVTHWMPLPSTEGLK